MPRTFQALVSAYKDKERSLARGVVAPPASAAEIERVQQEVAAQFGADLDRQYLELAAMADGISAQGTIIFSTVPCRPKMPDNGKQVFRPWIVEENRGWRLDDPVGKTISSWIIYGIGELEFIIQFLPSGTFQRRSRVDWNRVMDETDTFLDILWASFRQRLELD
jgi:hypothetical protein